MLSGVHTPMVTAFGTDGALDLDGNERIIAHLIDGGVSGILLLGSIGEFFALSMEEKKRLIRFAAEVVAGRTTLLVGTGGTVVDEDALVEALRQGAIAGAGLDVFAGEPLPGDSRLWGMENVLVTPHSSCMFREYGPLFAAEIAPHLVQLA